MENQTNVDDQNAQQIGQNPDTRPADIQNNSRINLWMIPTLILGFLLLLVLSVNFLGSKKPSGSTLPPKSSVSPTRSVGKVSLVGTVKTGAQLGEVKSHCSNGIYLVADDGTELINGSGTTMLLLRTSEVIDESNFFSDQQYVGKRVEVVGKYPAQENFCQALICACEDYILVDHVNIVGT